MPAHDPHGLDDTVMLAKFHQIVTERNIKVIVETGIHHGLSTTVLSRMVPTVFAVDNNMESLVISSRNFEAEGRDNIVLCAGSSPQVLRNLRLILPDETLYYLDAHWQDYWPLLDEIKEIKRGHGVIVVHDMYVPDHPELRGYTCNGHDLNYDYLKEELTNWSPTHIVEYNEKSEGTNHPVGIGYFYTQ